MTIVLYWIGALTTGFAADNVYNVFPNDKGCEEYPCLNLSYLIDNHQNHFTSNTTIVFSDAEYNISTNVIIQNVSNFSLIGTSYSKIICFPENQFIYFYNVVNIMIKNMSFSHCGNSINNNSHWASIVFDKCTNVHISKVYIITPIGYGVIAYNMYGYNILENVSIHLGRLKPFKDSRFFTCGYGLHLSYIDSDDVNTDKYVFASVSNISLTMVLPSESFCDSCCGSNYYERFKGIFEVFLKQFNYAVLLEINNSNFSNLIGNVVMIKVEAFNSNGIHFNNCKFTHINNGKLDNKISLYPVEKFSQIVVSFYQCDDYSAKYRTNVLISLVDCEFSQIKCNKRLKVNSAILHVESVLTCYHKNASAILIRLSNITFFDNIYVLINIAVSMNNEPPPIIVVTEDVFHVKENMIFDNLIYLNNAQMHFNGVTRFVRNYLFTSIIFSDSAKLTFTNTTIFHKNEACINLLNLNGK